jgi:hypothetical protein
MKMMRPISKLDAALEYLERGWSIIPIKPEGKRPAIKWIEYQTRQPTKEEVIDWFERWPDYDIAIVTGEVSGLVVVDCDNQDALHAAWDAGMRSPIKVKTKRGCHLYFSHPKDGIRRGPRAGYNSRGADWPKINGLDFRGDGSYALLPPSNNYEWDFPEHVFDWDEMPVWKDWHPKLPPAEPSGEFSFDSLDLSDMRVIEPDELLCEWDRTAKFVRERFPSTLKIPTGLGNGRNQRVMYYISESIKDGAWGAELRRRGYAFMNEFFEDQLPEREFEATVRSMEEAEKRNHPDRFDEHGQPIVLASDSHSVVEPEKPKKLIQMKDADELLANAKSNDYMIEPWLPRGTIVQVYGYSGHGKSMFVQHAMAALTAGRKYFGPFEVGGAAKVLYLNFEEGMATIGRRLIELKGIYGDTQDRLNIWTPFIDGVDMNLNTREGLVILKEWIDFASPDVVVIDTIRTAYPGLQENSAEDWAKINKLSLAIRNSGVSVILLHHSNKPGENGVGREAGSTNQLTTLETQIRITQVYNDKDTAVQKAGLFDGDYSNPVWPLLQAKLAKDYHLYMVIEVRYGKVREWTDLHDAVQWIGFATNHADGKRCIVSSRSTKQKAKDLALDGYDSPEIATRLVRPVSVIDEWLGVPSR